eukprot:Nitzschia sp. Nitz4//scaffold152_size53828//46584//47007//NITZ4_006752-RA/size53828-augustus-gene-0.100-mRNA-1//-1//CDS//3329537232//1616//frame0
MVFGSVFKTMQESEASRIGRMAERVAEGSIDSQKQVDEFNRTQTFTHAYYLGHESRPRAFNSFTCVNSYFKGREGGIGSSYKTARYYNEQARNRRDELIAQVGGASA